jgi:MFS family permease
VNLLSTRRGRRILFTSLYLSEGAPIGFIWWALPTKLRGAGVEVDEITAITSLLVLPWMLKFLWSPLVDAVRTRRWTLRSWILSAQLLMGVSLLPLLAWDTGSTFSWVAILLLVHAFLASTQDAAIDALAIATVPGEELGSLNGWMQAGMLAGRSALGGGALVLEGEIGTRAVILVLIGVIWSSSLLLLVSRETGPGPAVAAPITDRLARLGVHLRSALHSRVTLLGLLFALLGGAGFESVGSVAGPFLIDRGCDAGVVGRFFALNSVVGMLAGAIAGGYVADRVGKRTAVSLSLAALVAAILGLSAYDAMAGPGGNSLIPAMTLVYVCIGLFTASSYALFMEITDPSIGATQFSAFMGATNGCESASAFVVGRIIPSTGYPLAFVMMCAVSVCALPLVRFLVRAPAERA